MMPVKVCSWYYQAKDKLAELTDSNTENATNSEADDTNRQYAGDKSRKEASGVDVKDPVNEKQKNRSFK